MRCTVKFRGYWPPSMEWRRHGEDNKNGQIVTADEVEESENFNITSAISIIFKSSINGSFFSCKIYFSAQKPRLHANASNTPDFSYVWKSPEITKTQANYPTSHHASLTTTPLETKHNSSTNICKCCWIIIIFSTQFFKQRNATISRPMLDLLERNVSAYF